MLSLETLGDYLQKNPSLMTSRASLQSLLKDIFPQDRLKVNLLLMGFDENVFSLLGKNPTAAQLQKLMRSITGNHGVTEENACYIIETWLVAVFKEKLPAGFGAKVSFSSSTHSANGFDTEDSNPAQELRRWGGTSHPPGGNSGNSWLERLRQVFGDPGSSSFILSNPSQSGFMQPLAYSRGLSVDDVQEVFFRTKERLMKNCGIGSSQAMGTWDAVDIRNVRHYCRRLGLREKELILRKLGKGLYQERDFAYVRTSTNMTRSWGVTYDSLVISSGMDLVIPFAEIDYVDSDRGLFTDTIMIHMKNGRNYLLNEQQLLATPVHDNISDLANFLNVVKEM